jgi:hypothetical protein
MARGAGGLRGRVYTVAHADRKRVRLALADVALSQVSTSDGQLIGANASVESRCVLFEPGRGGELFGRPMEPIARRAGALCFDPCAGGIRTRENRLSGGAFNAVIAEAARFGMVNAFFHVERAAAYLNDLLRELGAPALPVVHVVVAAHSGSRLPGFGQGDGDYRKGRLHPLQGGHYRVSTRTTGVPEPVPVRPGGEVHLGPGRLRMPFAGKRSYLASASHNLATIYHEYGHHLCRHTADFRLNGERRADDQRNGKTGPEEGVCDYFAASLLGTGHPYGWYRLARGERRDPAAVRSVPADDECDAHAIGARWSNVFWRTRETLLAQGRIKSPRDFDRVLVRALLGVGTTATRPGDRRRRRERAAVRAAPETLASMYVEALDAEIGGGAAGVAAELLATRRLGGGSEVSLEARAC